MVKEVYAMSKTKIELANAALKLKGKKGKDNQNPALDLGSMFAKYGVDVKSVEK